jgi:hypothetical protein
MDIFTYLPNIFCVRNDSLSPVKSVDSALHAPDIAELHKQMLARFHDDGGLTGPAMVYESELILTRELADLNDNEIRNFILDNADWDMIVLSDPAVGDAVSEMPGYNLMKKFADTSKFRDDTVYIASPRLFEKMKNGDTGIIDAYVYANSFAKAHRVTTSDMYTVSKVTSIKSVAKREVKYTWENYPMQ